MANELRIVTDVKRPPGERALHVWSVSNLHREDDPAMRTQKAYEERIETQRKNWKNDFDRRWARVEETSAKAKREFHKWLNRFNPQHSAVWKDLKTKYDNTKSKLFF